MRRCLIPICHYRNITALWNLLFLLVLNRNQSTLWNSLFLLIHCSYFLVVFIPLCFFNVKKYISKMSTTCDIICCVKIVSCPFDHWESVIMFRLHHRNQIQWTVQNIKKIPIKIRFVFLYVIVCTLLYSVYDILNLRTEKYSLDRILDSWKICNALLLNKSYLLFVNYLLLVKCISHRN